MRRELRHNNSHENIIQLMRRVCGTRIELNFDAICAMCVRVFLRDCDCYYYQHHRQHRQRRRSRR